MKSSKVIVYRQNRMRNLFSHFSEIPLLMTLFFISDSLAFQIYFSTRTNTCSRLSEEKLIKTQLYDLVGTKTSEVVDNGGIHIGIAGTGAISKGSSAIIAQNGHSPMMWSPSGSSFSDPYQIPTITATGAMDYYFSPRIATSAQTLVQENDVILIALPANGHKKVFDELAPWIQEGQHVIISSHSSLGALYLSTLMQQRNINIDITCWGTTVCTARSNAENTVLVNTIRSAVDFCTVPSQKQLQAAQLCCELFGDRFRPREGLLAISLSNLNPQNHLGIALGNISRIEKAEAWYQFENITPNIGRFLEELDQERLNIAKALKLDVKTVYEHFSQGFHVPITDSISDMNQEIHAAGKDVYGPKIADSRYVTEDVPFGLALIIVLGNFVNRPAILHQSGLQILSAMYGRDFMNENDLLDALNLGDYELEELKSAALTGFLKNNRIRSSI